MYNVYKILLNFKKKEIIMKNKVYSILSVLSVMFTFACGGAGGSDTSSSEGEEITIEFSQAVLPDAILALDSSDITYGVQIGPDYETGCSKNDWEGSCDLDLETLEAHDGEISLSFYYLKDTTVSAQPAALVRAAKKPIFNENQAQTKKPYLIGQAAVKIPAKQIADAKGKPLAAKKPINFDILKQGEFDLPLVEVEVDDNLMGRIFVGEGECGDGVLNSNEQCETGRNGENPNCDSECTLINHDLDLNGFYNKSEGLFLTSEDNSDYFNFSVTENQNFIQVAARYISGTCWSGTRLQLYKNFEQENEEIVAESRTRCAVIELHDLSAGNYTLKVIKANGFNNPILSYFLEVMLGSSLDLTAEAGSQVPVVFDEASNTAQVYFKVAENQVSADQINSIDFNFITNGDSSNMINDLTPRIVKITRNSSFGKVTNEISNSLFSIIQSIVEIPIRIVENFESKFRLPIINQPNYLSEGEYILVIDGSNYVYEGIQDVASVNILDQSGYSLNSCGNGIVEDGETCDLSLGCNESCDGYEVEANFVDSEMPIQVSSSTEDATFRFNVYGRERVQLAFRDAQGRCLNAQNHVLNIVSWNQNPPPNSNRSSVSIIADDLNVSELSCFTYELPVVDDSFTFKRDIGVFLTNESEEPLDYVVSIRKSVEMTSADNKYYSASMGDDLFTQDKFTLHRNAGESPRDYSFSLRGLLDKACLGNLTLKVFDVSSGNRRLIRRVNAGENDCATFYLNHADWGTDLEILVNYYGLETVEYLVDTQTYPVLDVNETVSVNFEDEVNNDGLLQTTLDLEENDKYELNFSIEGDEGLEIELMSGIDFLYYRLVSVDGMFRDNGNYVFRQGIVKSNYLAQLPTGDYRLEIYNLSGNQLLSMPAQFRKTNTITYQNITQLSYLFTDKYESESYFSPRSIYILDPDLEGTDFYNFTNAIVDFRDANNEIDNCKLTPEGRLSVTRENGGNVAYSRISGDEECENYQIQTRLGSGHFTLQPHVIGRNNNEGLRNATDPDELKINFTVTPCDNVELVDSNWQCRD